MSAKKISFILLVLFFVSLACNLPGQTPAPTEAAQAVETEPLTEEAAAEEAAAEEPVQPEELQPALELDAVQFQPGAVISVHFTAPASYDADAWVGMVPSNTPHGSEEENDNADLGYEHLEGCTQGIILFNAPQDPGSYDIRMFNSDSGGQETASVTFEVPGTAAAAPDVNCNGISFSYDDTLATNAYCEVVPASAGGADSPGWEVYPAYDQVNFEGYLLQGTFHSPHLFVFPVAEYEAMNESARGTIDDLRVLLANQPAHPDHIPFLPMFNAAQMLRTKVHYLDFQNGSGVRFLTQYGQAAYPINNESLFYTFQGITSDGNYYVAAIFPVSHPDLPVDNDDLPNGDWDTFVNNFENYIIDTQIELDGKPGDSFQPSLLLLDQLIQSLKVE